MKLHRNKWSEATSTWMLVGCAMILAALLVGSLGSAGASMLFQSPISPPGPSPTDTPVVIEEPTVIRTPTVIVVKPTPLPTSAELPPPLPTSPGQPTLPPPPTRPLEQPTFTPVPPVPISTVAPQPTAGGPMPILWVILGLVIVGLFVVIAISPKKPSSEE